jgi:hypothetical protein
MPRSDKLPHPKMTVRDLAKLALLDTLDGTELAIYLRLVAATAEQHTKTVAVTNAELFAIPRRAMTALRRLEGEHGLIKIHWNGGLRRTIEVR